MITDKAKLKAKVLILLEKHGIEAALDTFTYKMSTLYTGNNSGNVEIRSGNKKWK